MPRQVLSLDPNCQHGWTKLPNDHPFELIRKQWWGRWWGSNLESHANYIVSITNPSTPSPDIPIQLRSTNGRVLIRAEYEIMYHRLEARHFRAPRKGVIISGQPGIGKTVFLFFVLIKKLARMDATLFYSPTTNVLLFQEDGTYSYSNLSEADEMTFSFGFDVWFLIDMDDIEEHPPPVVINASPWPVQAAPPNDVHFKTWKKQRRASTFIMNPWSEDEIRRGLAIQRLNVSDDFLPQTKATAEGCLSDTITKFGPVPLTVYEAAAAPAAYENTLGQVLKELTYKDLADAVRGATANPSPLSHQIILIKRDVCPTTELDEDTPLLDFISDHVARQVMQRFHDLDFRQVVTLSSLFRTSPQETSIAGDWLFEALAHQVLTLNVPDDDWKTLPPLRRMRPVQGSALKFSVEIPADSTVGRRPFRKGHINLPIKKEHLGSYSGIKDLFENTTRKYFTPQKRNNPLFDSLLFRTKPSPSKLDPSGLVFSEVSEPGLKIRQIQSGTVYALQMTTSHNHTSSDEGLRDLQMLKGVMAGVTFVFVLVVPRLRENRTYTWEMPQRWSTTRGLVYCQEIPSFGFDS